MTTSLSKLSTIFFINYSSSKNKALSMCYDVIGNKDSSTHIKNKKLEKLEFEKTFICATTLANANGQRTKHD